MLARKIEGSNDEPAWRNSSNSFIQLLVRLLNYFCSANNLSKR
jgi:hypothetical protein